MGISKRAEDACVYDRKNEESKGNAESACSSTWYTPLAILHGDRKAADGLSRAALSFRSWEVSYASGRRRTIRQLGRAACESWGIAVYSVEQEDGILLYLTDVGGMGNQVGNPRRSRRGRKPGKDGAT